MARGIKSTIITPVTVLSSKLTLRTSMPINAGQIITVSSETTRCHPCDCKQNNTLILRELVIVRVVAAWIRAFAEEEILIAQFQLLNAFQFVLRDGLEIQTINTLTILIAFYGAWSRRAGIRRGG